MTLATTLTTLLLAMQAYDFWSTHYVLTHGGRETNPLLLRLRNFIVYLPFGGPWLWLVLAKTWVIAILVVGWLFDAWIGMAGIAALVVLAAWYAYVLLGNHEAVRRAKKQQQKS